MDLLAVIIIIAVMSLMAVMTIMAEIASLTYCTCLMSQRLGFKRL